MKFCSPVNLSTKQIQTSCMWGGGILKDTKPINTGLYLHAFAVNKSTRDNVAYIFCINSNPNPLSTKAEIVTYCRGRWAATGDFYSEVEEADYIAMYATISDKIILTTTGGGGALADDDLEAEGYLPFYDTVTPII